MSMINVPEILPLPAARYYNYYCFCYLKLRHIAVILYGEVFSQQQYNQKAEAAKTSLIKKTSFTCLTKAS